MKTLDTVLCIVPRLPPAFDGVGDYALNLAKRLQKQFQINTHFIVTDPTWDGESNIDGFLVSVVNQHTSECLLYTLSKYNFKTILLHFVCYGYEKRGCPFWLVDGLRQWRENFVGNSLATMFHELAAFGPPWTSSFWLSPLQKLLAAQLACYSNTCLTNRSKYSYALSKWRKSLTSAVPAIPVFSNIGEPETLLPLNQRLQRMIIFGSRSWKLQAYRQAHAKLYNACKTLKVTEIWDIGESVEVEPSQLIDIPIIKTGRLSTLDISHIMSTSIAGFLTYPPAFLAKSGIFAAYTSHGLLPVCAYAGCKPIDGLLAGKHYWVPTNPLSCIEMQTIADNASSWYQSHNLSAHAEKFFSILFKMVND